MVFPGNNLSNFSILGWVVLSGRTSIKDPLANFRDSFSGSSRSGNDVSHLPHKLNYIQLICSGKYATATFKVLDAYAGWSNINYVMNDVKDPVRTLKIAGPLGLGICAAFYLLANVAYFAYDFSDPSVMPIVKYFLGLQPRRRFSHQVLLLQPCFSKRCLVSRHREL